MALSRATSQRWRGRARVAEAMALIAVASAARAWVPMPRWSSVLGMITPVPDHWRGEVVGDLPRTAADVVEYRVATAIRRGSALLPGTPSCLAEATAAQVMLTRRGESGVVVIGLRRGEPGASWDAHAWLLGRQGALTGGPAAAGFSPTTVFERVGGLRADDVVLSSAPMS